MCVDKVEHQVWEHERVVAPAVHERPVAQDARSSLRRHPAAHTSVSHTSRLQELLACATVNARLRVVTAAYGNLGNQATGRDGLPLDALEQIAEVDGLERV